MKFFLIGWYVNRWRFVFILTGSFWMAVDAASIQTLGGWRTKPRFAIGTRLFPRQGAMA
jgi:hypothetical protein